MNEFPDIKSRMYEKYPVLPGQYQYYQTSVCSNSEERQEFDTDWKHYLIYLDSASRNITFNQFLKSKNYIRYGAISKTLTEQTYITTLKKVTKTSLSQICKVVV